MLGRLLEVTQPEVGTLAFGGWRLLPLPSGKDRPMTATCHTGQDVLISRREFFIIKKTLCRTARPFFYSCKNLYIYIYVFLHIYIYIYVFFFFEKWT